MAVTFGASLGTPVTNTGASATTIAITTGVTVPPGGMLSVAVTWYHATATASLAGGGLSWALDDQQDGTTDTARHLALFSAQAPSGLAFPTAVTATFTSGSFGRAIFGVYYTGQATAAAKDVVASARGTTAAWNTTANTTTVADEVLAGAAWFDGPVATNTPDGTDTEALDFNNAVDASWCYLYRIVSSTASYDLGGTWSTALGGSSPEWLATMVTYKADTGATALPVMGPTFQAIPFMK